MTNYNEAQGSFSKLLHWHLVNGTRPTADGKQGREWTNKEFAGAVRFGITDKAVRNWRSGRNLPRLLDHIEKALFGLSEGEQYEVWRTDLRNSYRIAAMGVSSGTAPPDDEFHSAQLGDQGFAGTVFPNDGMPNDKTGSLNTEKLKILNSIKEELFSLKVNNIHRLAALEGEAQREALQDYIISFNSALEHAETLYLKSRPYLRQFSIEKVESAKKACTMVSEQYTELNGSDEKRGPLGAMLYGLRTALIRTINEVIDDEIRKLLPAP